MTFIHHESRGEGPPLLLLHGFTGTGGDWVHVFDIDALASSFRLIMPDARGHGRSSMSPGNFTFRACARDVLALLDHLGIDRVRAVGTSLGAKTLLHLATDAPSRVDAMVIVSAAPRSDLRQMARDVRKDRARLHRFTWSCLADQHRAR
jgi:pimeloyl-ACP methyl ester carboxylesterase